MRACTRLYTEKTVETVGMSGRTRKNFPFSW